MQSSVGAPQLSETVTAALAVTHGGRVGLHCRFSVARGQVSTGGVVSSTKVMCWTQVEKFPHASVAFQVRSIPGWPVQLAGAAESLNVITIGAGQLSVAVATPVLFVAV